MNEKLTGSILKKPLPSPSTTYSLQGEGCEIYVYDNIIIAGEKEDGQGKLRAKFIVEQSTNEGARRIICSNR